MFQTLQKDPSQSLPIPPLSDVAVRMNGEIPLTIPDLIPGFLPRQGQLVMAGETNVGKSLAAIETISSLVTGNPLWGGLTPTRVIKRVLYVLGEHYPEVIQRLYQKTKLPLSDEVFILGPEQLGYDKWLVQRGSPNLVALDKFKKWAEGIDLIVFDPLSAFLIGESENDNITMRLVLDMMSLVAQTHGASCMVLAHQGKPQMDQFGKEHSRTKYAVRGASAIEDAATNIFYLNRGDSSEAVVAASKGQVFEMVCRKYKGEAPSRYRLLRNSETLTHTLLDDANAYLEVLKFETRRKIANLQESNPDLEYRTCIKLVAGIEGVTEDTIKRRLGLVKD